MCQAVMERRSEKRVREYRKVRNSVSRLTFWTTLRSKRRKRTRSCDKKRIILIHILREYNFNRILLSCLNVWPYQSKLARCLLSTFCIMLEISYFPFEYKYNKAVPAVEYLRYSTDRQSLENFD